MALILFLLIPLGIFMSTESIAHALFYVSPFTRIADFIIGIFLFKVYDLKLIDKYIKSKSMATILELISLGLFVLFFIFHKNIQQGYRFSIYYWLPMILVILAFSYQSGYVSKFLSTKFLLLLGNISFSFYLIHQLAIRYITTINNRYPIIENVYLLVILIFTITLIASYFSYKFIEIPSNKYIKNKYYESFKKVKN